MILEQKKLLSKVIMNTIEQIGLIIMIVALAQVSIANCNKLVQFEDDLDKAMAQVAPADLEELKILVSGPKIVDGLVKMPRLRENFKREHYMSVTLAKSRHVKQFEATVGALCARVIKVTNGDDLMARYNQFFAREKYSLDESSLKQVKLLDACHQIKRSASFWASQSYTRMAVSK